jgi:hypothetical protein
VRCLVLPRNDLILRLKTAALDLSTQTFYIALLVLAVHIMYLGALKLQKLDWLTLIALVYTYYFLSKMVQKKRLFFFFVLSFTRSKMLYSAPLIEHFHKLQSVSFQMVSRICTSMLQVLSYRQLDLDMLF